MRKIKRFLILLAEVALTVLIIHFFQNLRSRWAERRNENDVIDI
ncbi:MAG: hypothetical protein ACLPT4_07320 [Verrucomicrobiia bacterium]